MSEKQSRFSEADRQMSKLVNQTGNALGSRDSKGEVLDILKEVGQIQRDPVDPPSTLTKMPSKAMPGTRFADYGVESENGSNQ